MKNALTEYFVPVIEEMGFSGGFPHYRRIRDKRVDLLSIVFDKWGGSFKVEISYADMSGGDSNLLFPVNDINPDELTIFKTKRNYKLPSSDDWFSFCDTVRVKTENGEALYSLTQKQKESFLANIPKSRYEIVKKVDENIYKEMAMNAVNMLPVAEVLWENGIPEKPKPEVKQEQPKPQPQKKKSLLRRIFGKKR